VSAAVGTALASFRDAMMKLKTSCLSLWFERFAQRATLWTGSTRAFALAVATIVLWAGTGFLFDFSDTWQLVINTGTTIVTFLMVFLVQRAQNKDALAIHLKLNEIVAALRGASNRMINVESLSEAEVRVLQRQYETLGEISRREENSTRSVSIESSLAGETMRNPPPMEGKVIAHGAGNLRPLAERKRRPVNTVGRTQPAS
jgi:low affinity Fe/Cu permease